MIYIDAYEFNKELFKIQGINVTDGTFDKPIQGINFIDKFQDNYYKTAVVTTINIIGNVLNHFPILTIDPSLEPSLHDTNSFIKDFKMPYHAFFVNQMFETEVGQIAGVYVYDKLEMLKFLLKQIKSDPKFKGMSTVPLEEDIKVLEDQRKDKIDIIHHIMLAYFYVQNNSAQFVFGTLYEFLYKDIQFMKELESFVSKHDSKIASKDALNYAINVANLITMYVDPKDTRNPQKEVRIYQDNYGIKKEEREHNHRSTIKVFGELKKQLDNYNLQKIYRNKQHIEATIVRGHWRHLKHDRYGKNQGKAIWIKPFYRGVDKELYSKIVNIVP